MIKKLLSSQNVRQFISYFGVGGVSALVEWGAFFLFDSVLGIQYMLATVLAFILSTTMNWFLGRVITFRDSAYKNQKGREIVLVFAVSAIGLLFNLGLMYLFVTVLKMNTSLWKIVAKVLATGIVFVWNFLARKLWIYRE